MCSDLCQCNMSTHKFAWLQNTLNISFIIPTEIWVVNPQYLTTQWRGLTKRFYLWLYSTKNTIYTYVCTQYNIIKHTFYHLHFDPHACRASHTISCTKSAALNDLKINCTCAFSPNVHFWEISFCLQHVFYRAVPGVSSVCVRVCARRWDTLWANRVCSILLMKGILLDA